MEPKMEQPKQYTPEEMAGLEKSRLNSDENLISKFGAAHVNNENGERANLEVDKDVQEHLEEMHKIEDRTKLFKDIAGALKEAHENSERKSRSIEEMYKTMNEQSSLIDKMSNTLMLAVARIEEDNEVISAAVRYFQENPELTPLGQLKNISQTTH